MGNTVNCQLDIHQPNRVIWQNRGQSASLPCHLNVNCSGFQFLWFVFKEDSHHQIDLETKPHKYSQDGARLTINSLNGNDSGIYHCAAVFPKLQPVPRAPEIGPGTKLAVRGKSPLVSQCFWEPLSKIWTGGLDELQGWGRLPSKYNVTDYLFKIAISNVIHWDAKTL